VLLLAIHKSPPSALLHDHEAVGYLYCQSLSAVFGSVATLFFLLQTSWHKPYALLKLHPNYPSQLNASKALVGLARVQRQNRG